MPVLRACGLCVLWLSALLVASARWTWAGEVLCHFGPFLALFGLALALTCLLAKEPRRALSCLPASLLLGFPFLELRLAAVPEGAPGPTLEVASANLLWGSRGGEQLLAWLASGGPELLFLCELDPDTRARLLELEAAGYGFRFVWPPPEQWTPETIGRALLSKRPLTEPRVHWPGPLLEAQFELDGRPLHVFGAHPLRPGRPSFTRERNQTLARLPAGAALAPPRPAPTPRPRADRPRPDQPRPQHRPRPRLRPPPRQRPHRLAPGSPPRSKRSALHHHPATALRTAGSHRTPQ